MSVKPVILFCAVTFLGLIIIATGIQVNQGVEYTTTDTNTDYYMADTFNFTSVTVYSTSLYMNSGNITTYPQWDTGSGHENYSTYTEVDPGLHLTVTTNNISGNFWKNADSYVYDDKGVAHFDGDFEHQVEAEFPAAASGTYCPGYVWSIANDVDDWRGLMDGGKDAIGIYFRSTSASNSFTICIEELVAGAENHSSTFSASPSTRYYLTIDRNESIGTYGNVTCKIYSDFDRTNLLDTLSLALHEKEDFRYVYGAQTYNYASAKYIHLGIDNLSLDVGGFESLNMSMETLSVTDFINFTNNKTATNITIENGYANFSITNGLNYTLKFQSNDTTSQDVTASSGEIQFTNVNASSWYISEKESGAESTPVISNVQNDSISSTSQYVNWTVNQTAHNRVLYSNESDLTPAYYSSWDNTTAAPNITLSALEASTQYWYQVWSYNTTNTSLSANSTTMNFTTVFGAPIITLLEQSPATVYMNSTGAYTEVYGIQHNAVGLNKSSVAYTMGLYDPIKDSWNWSYRTPSNNISAFAPGYGNILRQMRRNRTDIRGLSWESNTNITEGNIWKWTGADNDTYSISWTAVNSTYTNMTFSGYIFLRMSAHMHYLDLYAMTEDNPKSTVRVMNNEDVMLKMWDPENIMDMDNNFIMSVYFDTVANEQTTSIDLDIWACNQSWDSSTDYTTDTTNCTYMTAVPDSAAWLNHTYSTYNSSFSNPVTVSATDRTFMPDPSNYIILTSDVIQTKRAYLLNVSSLATITNVSFANTNTLWTGAPGTWSQESSTPVAFFVTKREGREMKSKLHVADNDDLWSNSTINSNTIGASVYPPTIASVDHFHYEGQEVSPYDLTFRGTVGVCVYPATDPDGGNVTHNLTLWYANQSACVGTINNTFTDDMIVGAGHPYVNVSFDTTPYYSTTELYTLKVVATDEDSKTSTNWGNYNFTLAALGTTGCLNDSGERVTFWGIANIPALCTTANNANLIEHNATTDEYLLKISFHQSQYGDTFNINETVRVNSYNNDSTPFYRGTGNQVIANATITSWNVTTQSLVTSAEEYRTYIYTDPHFSTVNITNSNCSFLGNGNESYHGVWIGNGEGATINNNTFIDNYRGLYIQNGGNFTISNNTVTDPSDHSISIYDVWGNVTVRDNVITSDVETRGISTIRGGSNNEFINNSVTGEAQSGFYNQYTNDSLFSANTMDNVQNGIVFSTTCDNNTITGNNITVEMDIHGYPAWGITIMSGTHTIQNNTINATGGYGIVMSNLYTSVPCVDSLLLNNSIKTTVGTHTDAGVFADYVMNMNSTGNTIRNPYDSANTISINNDISDIRIENTDNTVFSEDSSHLTYAHLTNFSLYADTNEAFNITQLNMTALPSTDKLGMWNVEWGTTVAFNVSSVTGANPTWYNVTNATWATETIDIYRNNSLFSNELADANGTITYNYSDSYSQKYFVFQVQGAAANYTPPNPTTLANTTGNFWVNHTWSAGGGNVTDSYNVSWNLTWYNTTTDEFMEKEVGASNWANVTVYAFNSSGSGTLSAGSISDNVQAPAFVPGEYIPATPTSLANTTGNGWVNYTWASGGGANVTDSYNVSWNSTWYNNTLTTYMNDSVGEFGWANITVWAYNTSGSGSLSPGSVSSDTQAGGGAFTTSMTTAVYNLITYYGASSSSAEQFGIDIGSVNYTAMYNGSFYSHTMGFSANNFTVYHGIGYYVYLNASGSSTYQRNNISDSPYNTQLYNRWNTVGWTNSTDTNAEGIASSIGSACKYTSSLNADGVTYTTHTVGFTSNNHAVEKGEGYWVWTNTGTTWSRNS